MHDFQQQRLAQRVCTWACDDERTALDYNPLDREPHVPHLGTVAIASNGRWLTATTDATAATAAPR